jgi:hypothetical protein
MVNSINFLKFGEKIPQFSQHKKTLNKILIEKTPWFEECFLKNNLLLNK